MFTVQVYVGGHASDPMLLGSNDTYSFVIALSFSWPPWCYVWNFPTFVSSQTLEEQIDRYLLEIDVNTDETLGEEVGIRGRIWRWTITSIGFGGYCGWIYYL